MLDIGFVGLKQPKSRAMIVCPSERVASMNRVVVQAQAPMNVVREADAVIFGSGIHMRKL
jgi:hypothetical protein